MGELLIAVDGVTDLLDDAAKKLAEPEWEWLSIGDNNLLAWEVANKTAKLTGEPPGDCYPIVASHLRNRWKEKFSKT